MMSFLIKTLIRMTLLIGIVICGLAIMIHPIIKIFSHNIILNSLIFSVISFGVLWSFYTLFRVQKEYKWLKQFEKGYNPNQKRIQPYILSSLAILLGEKRKISLSPLNAKTILNSVETRLDESRDVSRYIIGLLIFLGLLGTFWGLSQTIGAIAGVIGSIDIQANEAKNAFSTLKEGLNAPLSGMGTAFSCSMFGLAGSLIVGFLDLQVSRASTHFYNELEDYLALSTHVSDFQEKSHEGAGPAYTLSLLEHVAESLSALQSVLKKSEENRVSMAKSLQSFSERLCEMSEQNLTHQAFSQRLSQNQAELQELLLNYIKAGHAQRQEEILKTHLRSMDTTLSKILEETIEGRNKSTQELRNEIKMVSKTISALASGQDYAA